MTNRVSKTLTKVVKFSFQWMDDPIAYEDKFGVQKTVLTSLILRKPEVNGKCFCVPCNTLVSYANRGKIAWMDHLKSGKHVDSFRTMINNNKLRSNFTWIIMTPLTNHSRSLR